MPVTYCTAVEVANILNLTTAEGDVITSGNISQLVNPNQTIIEKYINRAEQYIDSRTFDTWRSTQIGEYEYHDFTHRDRRRTRESPHPVIKLQHDYIETFSSGAGDKFEILTANDTWTDLVATGTAGTTPRDSTADYFLNKKNGRVYLLGDLPMVGEDTIRTIYTYGGDKTVPDDINEICAMIAAQRILDYLPDTVIKAETMGGGVVQYGKLSENWKRYIEEVIAERNKQAFRPIYL